LFLNLKTAKALGLTIPQYSSARRRHGLAYGIKQTQAPGVVKILVSAVQTRTELRAVVEG